MLAGYVYLVTNRLNGKKYVGCTKTTIEERWKKHVREARVSTRRVICRAIKQHGPENFEVTCLEVVEGSHADLMCAEIRQISLCDCVMPKGYNMTRGGDGGDLLGPVLSFQRPRRSTCHGI